MSTKILLGAATAAGFAAVVAMACPAAAAPVSTGTAGLAPLAQADVVHVAKKAKKKRAAQRRVYPREAPAVYPYDTVGSLGYDGYGYAYNRFSGQRYMSCVFDEGYGRTRPCDAGGGGGGGRN